MRLEYFLSRLRDKRIFVFMLLIILLGFVLRLYHLGTPSLWTDEMSSLFRAKLSLGELKVLYGIGSSSDNLAPNLMKNSENLSRCSHLYIFISF